MQYMFLHTMGSTMTQESMLASVEMGKKLIAKPEDYAPGAKLQAVYAGRARGIIFCLWDAPDLEILMPACEQMHLLGWDTEVVPIEKMEVHLEKFAKAMVAMKPAK